ncbi:MAG: radical SAM protein [bacterium]|nr:radical SAM protein [bacterium]
MKCVFCQNYPISHLFNGTYYTVEELAGLFLNLQERGAHNINFVSPSPYLYHAVRAIRISSKKGLTIPIVYNTSGYERPEVIAALNGIVDVYMPDLKYHEENNLCKKYSGITDYFDYAYPAIIEMFDQVGELGTDGSDIAIGGMILRHMILPGEVENSKRVLKIISQSPFRETHLSLMSQYFPAYKATEITEINRRLRPDEYAKVKEYALSLGFEKGWFQDLVRKDASGGPSGG